jgi:peptidyl-prolyl cis-trans isomerase B (cyclophilin B)
MKNWYLLVIFGLALVGAVYWLGKQPSPSTSNPKPTLSEPKTQEGGLMDVTNQSTASGMPESSESALAATKVQLITSKGAMVLELFPDQAPQTVKNFLTKAQSGFYQDLTFHRVEDWVVQGGDPAGNGTGGGTMPTELNKVAFERGSLGVARGNNIALSNDAQFFICTKDCNWLTGQYTNFGKVIEGMEVVDKIEVGDKIEGMKVLE